MTAPPTCEQKRRAALGLAPAPAHANRRRDKPVACRVAGWLFKTSNKNTP